MVPPGLRVRTHDERTLNITEGRDRSISASQPHTGPAGMRTGEADRSAGVKPR